MTVALWCRVISLSTVDCPTDRGPSRAIDRAYARFADFGPDDDERRRQPHPVLPKEADLNRPALRSLLRSTPPASRHAPTRPAGGSSSGASPRPTCGPTATRCTIGWSRVRVTTSPGGPVPNGRHPDDQQRPRGRRRSTFWRMLSDEQGCKFASRGDVLVPNVVNETQLRAVDAEIPGCRAASAGRLPLRRRSVRTVGEGGGGLVTAPIETLLTIRRSRRLVLVRRRFERARSTLAVMSE